MEIVVWPKAGIADEYVNIRVEHLSPNECYTLVLSTVDEKDTLFKSCARYTSDKDGRIDVRRDAALSADCAKCNVDSNAKNVDSSYTGVFGEGLFVMLQPVIQYERLVRRDVTQPLQFALSVWKSCSIAVSDEILHRMTSVIVKGGTAFESDMREFIRTIECPESPQNPGVFANLLGVQRIDRHLMGPGVQRVPVKEGTTRGTLFIPQGEIIIQQFYWTQNFYCLIIKMH